MDYEVIKEMEWPELVDLWATIEAARVTRAEAAAAGEDTTQTSGKEFEYLLLRAFQLGGADVSWPYEVRYREFSAHALEQIDGAVHLDGRSYLVESKDTAAAISYDVVAKLQAQIRRRPPGTVGIIFARAGFTASARYTAMFGVAAPIVLWDKAGIERAMADHDFVGELKRRYRYLVEHNVPESPKDSKLRAAAKEIVQ